MLKSISLKSKVATVFSLIVTLLLGVFALFIYLFFKDTQQNIFSERLLERAHTTANLILEKDELDSLSFQNQAINLAFNSGIPHEVIEVYDERNQRVFTKPLNLHTKPKSIEQLNRIRKAKHVERIDGQLQSFAEVHRDNQGSFIIIIEAPDTIGLRKEQSLRYILAFGLLLAFLVTVAIGWFFAQRLIKPFSRIISETQRITEHNLANRLTITNESVEIQQLVYNINDLLSRLEQSFQAQKVFIANVSHEIRTPLSIILGELEIASLEKDESARQAQLWSFREEVRRLVRLSEQLLWLAHTARDRQDIYFSDVRMDEVVFEAMQSIGRIRAENRKVNVNYEKDPTDDSLLMVTGNNDLLRALFINLIENGLKYSPENTEVNVNIGFGDNEVTVKVINEGAGIPLSEQPKIFKPFYRSTPTKNQVAGHGIGLYLCKQIALVHNATLDLQSEPGKGAVVELRFRRA
ncbi:MAG: ATP-binding protein [Cytophagales bacterium]